MNEVFNDYFGFISNFIFEKEVGKTASGSTTFSLSNYFYLKDFLNTDINFGVLGFSEFDMLVNLMYLTNKSINMVYNSKKILSPFRI